MSAAGEGRAPRQFRTLEDLCAIFSISKAQAYALVRGGDIRAIRVGGNNHWRIEDAEIEAYIQRAYEHASAEVAKR